MDAIIKATRSRVLKKEDETSEDKVTSYMGRVNKAVRKVVIVPATLEACIVYMVDTLTSMGADFEDLVALKVATRSTLPVDVAEKLGTNGSDIINTLVTNLIVHSYGKDEISYGREIATILKEFKYKFLYPHYRVVNSWLDAYGRHEKVRLNMSDLQDRMDNFFGECMNALHDPSRYKKSPIVTGLFDGLDVGDYLRKIPGDTDEQIARAAIDYISGFTDNYFIEQTGGV